MRKLPLAIAAIFILSVSILALAADESVMVDSTVAVIGNELITLENIRVETDILLRTKSWFSITEPPVHLTDQIVFEESVVRLLLYNQARKMGFAEVQAEEVSHNVKLFREGFGQLDSYKKWLLRYELRDEAIEIPEEVSYPYFNSIDKRFFRELAILQYLEKKIGIQVKLALNSYVEENKTELLAKFPEADDELLHDLARDIIYREKLDAHIKELKKREKIIILRDTFR